MKNSLEFISWRDVSLLFAVAVLMVGCNSDEDSNGSSRFSFQVDGLQELIVNELLVGSNSDLLAATSDGVYRKNINSDGGWTELGLKGRDVHAIAVFEDGSILASTIDFTQESYDVFLSDVDGLQWTLTSDFGDEVAEPLFDLHYDNAQDILYGSGPFVVAKSTDRGASWTVIAGDWQTVASGIKTLHVTGSYIWAGGQNAVEELILFKINGQTGQNDFHRNLLPAPSAVTAILPNEEDADDIMIGGEGGIIHTLDGGDNWTLLLEDAESRFFFGLEQDLLDQDKLYAFGWLKNFDETQPLVLFYSEDGGQNWSQVTLQESGIFGGVIDSISVLEEGKQVIYLGLHKGGVVKVPI